MGNKFKPKKTLLKRVKITKSGKILKHQVNTGHLKRKWDSNKKTRKTRLKEQTNAGHKKLFKAMLGKLGKKI